MARKDSYNVVKVHSRIYRGLKERIKKDSKDYFKLPSMNAYCENILWDYVKGKLRRTESKEKNHE